MELALLVWLVDLLGSAEKGLIGLLVILGAAGLFGGFWALLETGELSAKYLYWKTAIAVGFMIVLIPSEKTIQYMAGAYLVQTAYESEFVNKASELGQKAILNQLSKWAEDNPEVKTLLDTATEAK